MTEGTTMPAEREAIVDCDETCPECKGNHHIGGDLQSPWACTTYVRRNHRPPKGKNNA